MKTTGWILLLALAAPAAKSHDAIVIAADTPLHDVLTRVGKETGKTLLWNPNSPSLRTQMIATPIEHKITDGGRFDAYRAILLYYDIRLIAGGRKGSEIYWVVGSRDSKLYTKQRVKWVDYRTLLNENSGDSEYVACVVPVSDPVRLQHLRTALSMLSSPAGVGRIGTLRHSIVIADLAPNVRAMIRVVLEAEKLGASAEQEMAVIRLNHVKPGTVVGVLRVLYAPIAPTMTGRKTHAAPQAVSARFASYDPLNAVAVTASRAEMIRIRKAIEKLDQAPAQ